QRSRRLTPEPALRIRNDAGDTRLCELSTWHAARVRGLNPLGVPATGTRNEYACARRRHSERDALEVEGSVVPKHLRPKEDVVLRIVEEDAPTVGNAYYDVVCDLCAGAFEAKDGEEPLRRQRIDRQGLEP